MDINKNRIRLVCNRYGINDNDEIIVLADLLDSMREKIEDNKESDKLKQNVKMIK